MLGVLLSVWGTYLLTRWYHPFRFWGFLGSVLQVTGLFVTGRRERATSILRAAAKFGRLNEEERAESLIGLCLIFVGFLLQAMGALCWGADVVWGLLRK
jgi:hypothetical protein